MRQITLAALLLLFLATSAEAIDTTVKVVTPAGPALENATIQILNPAGDVVAEERTDDDGVVIFDLPEGSYTATTINGTYSREVRAGDQVSLSVPLLYGILDNVEALTDFFKGFGSTTQEYSDTFGLLDDQIANQVQARLDDPSLYETSGGDAAGTAGTLGAVQVAVERKDQAVAQARVTIYRNETAVTSRSSDAAGMALIPLEAGEYTVAVTSDGQTVRKDIDVEREVVTSFTADPSRDRFKENDRPFGRYRPVETSRAERDYAVSAAEINGLLSVRVESPLGVTFLAFPAYVVPRETVTWSAKLLPSGATDEEREQHRSQLSRQVITIDGERYALATSTVWTMEARASAKVSIAVDERGKTQVEFQLSLVTRETITTTGTATPLSATAGWPFRIPGSFDGVAGTTTVTFAGTRVDLLAESSSAVFFNPPKNALGVQTVEITEAGNPGQQVTVRNADLALSVDQNRLWKGESTPLHLRALGLQGITRPMFLVLINRTTPVISITRGEYQCWVIRPSDVIATGEVAYERAVRGTRRGLFFIDAILTSF